MSVAESDLGNRAHSAACFAMEAFMFGKQMISWIVLGASMAFMGCGASRDVEVSGEVSAPATVGVQGAVLIEFFDLTPDGDAFERTSVHNITLESIGAFDETISVEGDKILVRAINDSDGDGACSAGELWAEAEADVAEDDTVTGVSLQLAAQPCPGE
jgi:hypothetical protein